MTTHYGDYHGFVTSSTTAYPISYSGSGLFDMSPLTEELMDLLPSYFFLGNNNRRIMEMIAVILADYQGKIDEVRDQFFVETATWGLVYWEQLVGLPIDGDNLDYEARRAAILLKLMDCSTEKCFVEGIERIIKGQVIAIDLDPVKNPYQVNIELKSIDITFSGPKSSPVAEIFGAGPLNGDYTYRVTYEFEPVVIPDYISLFPYTNSSGLYGTVDVIGQRQFIKTTGAGSFRLKIGGIEAHTGGAAFSQSSTAADIVAELRVYLKSKYGEESVSTPYPLDLVGNEGVLLIFEGPYTKGVSLPPLSIVDLTGALTGSAVIAGNPEFVQPEVIGETPSGISPTRVTELQEIGPGLFDPATALAPFESDISGTASASLVGSVVYGAGSIITATANDSVTLRRAQTTSRWGAAFCTATAAATLNGKVKYGSSILAAVARAVAVVGDPILEVATIRGTPTLVLGTAAATLVSTTPGQLNNVSKPTTLSARAVVALQPYVDRPNTILINPGAHPNEAGDGYLVATATATLISTSPGQLTHVCAPMAVNIGASLANLADGTGALSTLITAPYPGSTTVMFAHGHLNASASAVSSGVAPLVFVKHNITPQTATATATATCIPDYNHAVLNTYSDLYGTATATMSGNVHYKSAVLTATARATVDLPTLRLNPPPVPLVLVPITSGTFIIKYNTIWDKNLPPIFESTEPLPFNATAAQVLAALVALPSIYPNSLAVTGGPLPSAPIFVEFIGVEAGFPQALLVIDNTKLVGGYLEVIRNRAGHTAFSGSESNTVTTTGIGPSAIRLTNVPRSPDGASKRNIYRKKTEAPYNEWRYVGSINDNVVTTFVDDIDDDVLSESQIVVIYGTGTYRLRFDGKDAPAFPNPPLNHNSSASDVKNALQAISTLTYPQVGVTVTGTSTSSVDGGVVVKFDGGIVVGEDVSGKDVPKMEVVFTTGVTGYVATTGPRRLTEKNTAFTYTFQRALEYIYVTKPAHLRIRELRSAAFRASINSAGDPV